MANQGLARLSEGRPALFDDFFKPWNDWFDRGLFSGRLLTVPAVNITEHKNEYQVALAVPGMKKDDFKIHVEGTLLTISAEREENKEEQDKKYTRKEYDYFSFNRSFTLPDEVNSDKIDARYEDGVLKIILPRKEAKMAATKQITVK